MKIARRSSIQVRTTHGQHAVFAAELIRAGQPILEFTGTEGSAPGRHSLQIGKERHLFAFDAAHTVNGHRRSDWQFINHSCIPNGVVRGRSLVALYDIPAGTEITFDYNTTEWDMSNPFECWCGHEGCVGLVRGYRWLSEAAREMRREITAPHLLEVDSLAVAATDVG